MRPTTPLLATIALSALAIAAFAGNSLLARAAPGGGQIGGELLGAGTFTAIRCQTTGERP